MPVYIKSKIPVELSPLMADKLSATVDIPKQYRDEIRQQLIDDGATTWDKRYALTKKIPLNSQCLPYLHADKSGDDKLIIQADNKVNPSYNFLRLDYNPAKIDLIQLPGMVEHYLPFPMSFSEIIQKARINRIDLTVDAIGVEMDSLAIRSALKQWSQVFNNKGRTVYLGHEEARIRFRVYDKGYFEAKKNAQKCVQLKEPVPTETITRIECQIMPSVYTTLEDLKDRTNPFSDLSVFQVPETLIKGDDLLIQTMGRARYEGFQAAIKALSPQGRKHIEAKIKFCKTPWWNPDAVWAQIPHLIQTLIDPKSAALAMTGTDG